MEKLSMTELLNLKGGTANGCVEILQYEANTHDAPDCEDPELVDRLESEYWEDWARRWFDCIGVEP